MHGSKISGIGLLRTQAQVSDGIFFSRVFKFGPDFWRDFISTMIRKTERWEVDRFFIIFAPVRSYQVRGIMSTSNKTD